MRHLTPNGLSGTVAPRSKTRSPAQAALAFAAALLPKPRRTSAPRPPSPRPLFIESQFLPLFGFFDAQLLSWPLPVPVEEEPEGRPAPAKGSATDTRG